MDRKSLLQQVEDAFKANPEAEQFHVTSDGMCFNHAGVARNHCKMLGSHGTIEVMSRDAVARELSGKGKEKKNNDAAVAGEDAPSNESGANGGAVDGGKSGRADAAPEPEAPATAAKKTAAKKSAKKK